MRAYVQSGTMHIPMNIRDALPTLGAAELANVVLSALWLLLSRVPSTIRVWHRRARQRQDLAHLDARLLRDIGIDARTAYEESRKWFWQI